MTQPDNALPAWIRRFTGSFWLLPLLFVLSLLEALMLPVPLELVLIPLLLIERQRLWLLAGVTLAGCLCGALLGYGAGAWLFDSLDHSLLAHLGSAEQFDDFSRQLAERGFMAILTVAVTPVPFQVAMLAAGAGDYPLGLFMLASAIGRGIRYYGLALLVRLTGKQALRLWRHHARPLGLALLGLALLGFGLGFWLND
ncbi:VTT domain-containing protein [Oceanimonas sp. NS1]|uniref:YqaA family protein n=1 Tax=Oceanimonas sp. MB9 TaxID=2588453 RepID=UPI0013F64462|nr:VTT domain-containing protein [Oceanimonas sp. MB9]MCT7655400.1 VTT domain-containing protein [Oceanimonas sp. NS1]NHI00313.1 hypothetical protein [Oceanimonas sp. MB9]